MNLRWLALIVLSGALLAGCAAGVSQPDKVVYHFSDGLPQASTACAISATISR